MYKIGFQQCTGFSLQLPQYSARLLLSRRCIEPETKKKHFGHYLLIFFQRDPVKTLVLHLIHPSSLSPVRSPIAVHSWDPWHRDVRPLAQPCIRRSLAGPEQILQKPVLCQLPFRCLFSVVKYLQHLCSQATYLVAILWRSI